jgi:hypothetical protein
MSNRKIPLENYVVASWLAEQCNVSPGIIHYYAVKQRLRYYLFTGIRYLERNDAMLQGEPARSAYRASETSNRARQQY